MNKVTDIYLEHLLTQLTLNKVLEKTNIKKYTEDFDRFTDHLIQQDFYIKTDKTNDELKVLLPEALEDLDQIRIDKLSGDLKETVITLKDGSSISFKRK